MLHPKKTDQTQAYPNHVRYCIKHQGYTIQEIADEIGTPRRTLTHYLSGNVPIPRQCLEKIAHTIGCEIEELLPQSVHPTRSSMSAGHGDDEREHHAFPSQTEAERTDSGTQELGNTTMSDHVDRSRRTFIRGMLGVTGTALMMKPQEFLSPQPWERLAMALAKPSTIDATTLDELEIITKSHWRLRTHSASSDLLHGVLGHLETVTELLHGSLSSSIRNRLCTIAGETSQIAGQIYFDMHDYDTALVYYHVSLDAAQEANNEFLQAVGLGRMSFLHTYNGHPEEALPLLEEAQHLAAQSATITTRSWLAAVEAEAYANIGESVASRKALERAEPVIYQAYGPLKKIPTELALTPLD